jgi:valyl-tRNA synthetase
MDKVYNHQGVEEKIYKNWEEKGYFRPEINPDGKPYSIILPPPNANAPLHFGHALMSVEDILIRYHRMKGDAALFLPGADHAGFETQFVYEKKLQSEGKSRFDYDRDTLYQMIWDHVQESRSGMENQLRRLGFSLDWSRRKFTLDPEIVRLVYQTFKKMYDEGLIYRSYRLVNYCTFDGTSFSDLEVVHEGRKAALYYIKYGPLVLATTRPETKFGDTAVAVNPKDERYKKYIGNELDIETVLGKAMIKVVADESVDPEFGTGVVKITPAHDFNDFEVANRHNLPMKQVIGYDGKMMEAAGKFAGMYVRQARKAIVEEMQQKGLIDRIDENYEHRVGLCYKCKNILEPLPLEQWFVKVRPLADKAMQAVKEKDIRIYPKNFEVLYNQWLTNLRDWNISRQTVWGMRIPAWRNIHTGEWVVTDGDAPSGGEWEQDTDTFDTWFSSGQWPIVTLKTALPGDFEKFYPTSVMETGYDILRAWVSRMVMLGIYITGEVPFRDVVLHGIVNDPLGKKMSKSKGNVVNPLELVEEFGADAVRFALVYGNSTGNDQALSYPKLDAARKFTNKLWNIGRFIEMKAPDSKKDIVNSFEEIAKIAENESDKEWVNKVKLVSREITKYLDSYQFNLASERLYEFIWHEFADIYIEDVKNRVDENSYIVLSSLYAMLLKLLHPLMPFVTEEIYLKLPGHDKSIMISSWPADTNALTGKSTTASK